MWKRARRGDQRFRASEPVPRHSPGPTPPARPARSRPPRPAPATPRPARLRAVRRASGLGPRHCGLSGLRARRAGSRPPAASARDRPSHHSPPHSPQSPACTSVACVQYVVHRALGPWHRGAAACVFGPLGCSPLRTCPCRPCFEAVLQSRTLSPSASLPHFQVSRSTELRQNNVFMSQSTALAAQVGRLAA